MARVLPLTVVPVTTRIAHLFIARGPGKITMVDDQVRDYEVSPGNDDSRETEEPVLD